MRRLSMHGFALGGVVLGGAATGYLASGSRRGAAIGAMVHVALFGTVGALFGSSGRLSAGERVFYGILGLGAGSGAGYLFWAHRRR